MWHASIARWGKTAQIPTERWGDGVLRDAKRVLLQELKGVGIEPTILKQGRSVLHMRRSLSDSEMGRLACEWLAIPAQDEFSKDGEMEMAL